MKEHISKKINGKKKRQQHPGFPAGHPCKERFLLNKAESLAPCRWYKAQQ